MSFDQWSGTKLPKGLPHKKAQRWLAEHPEVDPKTFWLDQVEKHERTGSRALKVAAILLTISVVIQAFGLIMRFLAPQ